MLSEQQLLEDLQHQIENNELILPTLPEVALKVRDVVEDDNANAAQIAEVVATDAALSARLLQVANSVLYRTNKPIESLQMAISRMGQNQVRHLVTSLVMQQMFQATSDVLDARLRRLWEHAVQVAAISRVIAGPIRGLDKDQALLAGLIHDIGTLPLLVAAEEIPELLEDEALLDRVIANLHPMLGAKILEAWQFAKPMIQVAAEHEDLYRTTGGAADYVDVVLVANLQSYYTSDHPHARIDWSGISAFERVGIESNVNVIEIEENQEELAEVEHILITAPS